MAFYLITILWALGVGLAFAIRCLVGSGFLWWTLCKEKISWWMVKSALFFRTNVYRSLLLILLFCPWMPFWLFVIFVFCFQPFNTFQYYLFMCVLCEIMYVCVFVYCACFCVWVQIYCLPSSLFWPQEQTRLLSYTWIQLCRLALPTLGS